MMRGVSLALACVFVAIALLFVRPVATPGPALRDFEAYWGAGVAWNAKQDPYARDVWIGERQVPGVDGTRDEVLPFVGPPATLPFWAAFARLPYAIASKLWYAVLALSLLALLVLLVRAAVGFVPPMALLSPIALAIAFGPMTSDLALGQVALLALLGATACVVLGSAPIVASLGAFAAYAQPNIAIALLWQVGRNRVTAALIAGGICTYLAGVLGAGWLWPANYASILFAHAASERLTAIQLSPAAIAYGFGAHPAVAVAIGYAVAAMVVVIAIIVARRQSGTFVRFASIAALVPLAVGFFHEHDLIVAFPAVVLCAFRARGLGRALAIVGTLLVAIDWLGLAQRPTGITQSALLALAAICAFAATGEEHEVRKTIVAGLCIAPLFALAAWLGAAHPSPVWPDALGAFHAPPTSTIAEVWNAEQQTAGLLRQNAVWAFLRVLSLTGCALLAVATSRQRGDFVV
jgi:hypothetical protein